MSRPELVETCDHHYFIIEGEPGAYSLFRVRVEHVASDRHKHVLRKLAHDTEAEPPSASEVDDWAERAADQRAGDLGPTIEPEPEAPKVPTTEPPRKVEG